MRRILQSSRNCWSEQPVASIGLLVDGDDYYRAFYEAAQTAEHTLLLAGWQFDTDACLLRGPESEGAPLPVTLLKFLDALCERTPSLRIYILAWDFHAAFALEREWMQEFRINWTTNDRITFLFDSSHVEQGSHHQKFVVIDQRLSFLGGLDLCDQRWDDRGHKDPNPLRVSRGEPHKPFHDVQAYLAGPEVASELCRLFATRWEKAGGEPITFPPASLSRDEVYAPRGAVPLSAGHVAIGRTDPQGSPTADKCCREICNLYLDAIAAAERSIYIETQYFSSHEVGSALAARLAGPGTLDVVLVLNMEAETLKEQIAVGLAQAQIIDKLRRAATGTRHRLGIYYTVPHTDGQEEPARATYIHSKIMVVDDRFMTVGSANLTNRSMVVDTELNMSIESQSDDDELSRSITRARQNLIAEHLGVDSAAVYDDGELVHVLDGLAQRKEGRLRLHPSPTQKELALLSVVNPQKLPFDPATFEDDDHRSLFAGGLRALWNRFANTPSARVGP